MMITITIYFYDKKTSFLVEDKKIECPDELVFEAAKRDDIENELANASETGKKIDYINCRSFEVTKEMKDYVIKHYPELKDKFDTYLSDFIGRHGLGPEYD